MSKAEAVAGNESLLGEAMIYVFLLAFSAGGGLLLAALVGYTVWHKWQARQGGKAAKLKRRGA